MYVRNGFFAGGDSILCYFATRSTSLFVGISAMCGIGEPVVSYRSDTYSLRVSLF